MTNDQIQAIKQIADKYGFELYDISEFSTIPTLTGRYDVAPENIEEFVAIQAELDAVNCGLWFSALELMSVDNIPPGHSERFLNCLHKNYKAGQESLKEAGF